MIEDSFVSFETSQRLFTLGFNERCYSYYRLIGGDVVGVCYSNSAIKQRDLGITEFLRPSYQVLIDWFYKKHGYFVSIGIDNYNRFLSRVYDTHNPPEKKKDIYIIGTFKSIEAAQKRGIEEVFKLI